MKFHEIISKFLIILTLVLFFGNIKAQSLEKININRYKYIVIDDVSGNSIGESKKCLVKNLQAANYNIVNYKSPSKTHSKKPEDLEANLDLALYLSMNITFNGTCHTAGLILENSNGVSLYESKGSSCFELKRAVMDAILGLRSHKYWYDKQLRKSTTAKKNEPRPEPSKKVEPRVSSRKSDVDLNIPTTDVTQPTTYALIIGNEDYSSFQTGLESEINVDYAENDARVFKNYCHKTLGVPEHQIKLLINATYGQMSQGVAWIKNLAKVEGENANLIFYYSGHGLPDEFTKEAYLMPVDISGTNVQGGLALKKVYRDLNEYPAKKITVFVDACFSGGARNQALIAMKGVKIKPKEEPIKGNMVVFTSSSGSESSAVYREKSHGYFTYYLLKKLQETKAKLSYEELSKYLSYNVSKNTALTGKIQTPQTNVSSSVGDLWKKWSFSVK